MSNKKQTPTGLSLEDEIRFWEENDLTQYIEDTREEEVQLSSDLKNDIISGYYNRKVKIHKSAMPIPGFVAQITASSSQGIDNCVPSCNAADNQAVVYAKVCNI